ncbi:MAG: type II toxin-antitoxin system death-on-curing family toxin [Trueperaceae bacterium]|nr:MAG: type II toxin-antitoxin system death-on-curing family toxin [Trueperaceae bacterium]
MHDYPTLNEVIAIHEALVTEFGGASGIRDMGALEAALMRPQLGYYQNLVDEAAALMESLGNNHPFIDGNKRVAFFVTDTFLRMNGRVIECDSDEAYAFLMGLFEERNFRFQALKRWLEDHVKPFD